MFLGVYRASQTAQAASQSRGDTPDKTGRPAAANTDLKSLSNQSNAHPLGAVPFGDGWLVIQL
jgi:hypothetical protein